MSRMLLRIIEKKLCADRLRALRWFVRNTDGGESLDGENGRIAIDFAASKITMDWACAVSKDSVERLGYKLVDAID